MPLLIVLLLVVISTYAAAVCMNDAHTLLPCPLDTDDTDAR